jgi:hypothetical protein
VEAQSLPPEQSQCCSKHRVAGIPEHMVFPDLRISPKYVSRGEGHLLSFNGLTDLSFASVYRKSLSHMQQIPVFQAAGQPSRHQVAGTWTGSNGNLPQMEVDVQASQLQKSGVFAVVRPSLGHLQLSYCLKVQP